MEYEGGNGEARPGGVCLVDRDEPPRVVVVGAGFAGLQAVRGLRRARVRITLLDRSNHHTFQPLLYQVATAALNASDIAVPVRRILRHQKNAEVLMADVTRIDVGARCVVCTRGSTPYDVLVLATGASHTYFGHDEWKALAPGLKTIDDALVMRRHVLSAFEAAERETDPVRQRSFTTFVVVGAGPTGVELAGALSEIARETLARDFRRVDPAQARIVLVEGTPRVLSSYPADLGEAARRQLERLHVEVWTDAMVTSIDEAGVSVGDRRIDARTVLWAAGVSASPVARTLGAPLDRAGRVQVEPDLTVPGHPEIYVVGDLAAITVDGRPVPGVAAAAIQEGRHVARNIERSLRGLPPLPFRYVDKGTMATIGRAAAVADVRGLHLRGFVAWVAWLVVHLYYLIGFRNRLLVLLGWAWAYVTFERGARLITGPTPELPRLDLCGKPEPRAAPPAPHREL